MARIAGIDLNKNKRIEIALTGIYGIGLTSSRRLLNQTGVNPDTKVSDLTEAEVRRLRELIENEYKVEGVHSGGTGQYQTVDGSGDLQRSSSSSGLAGQRPTFIQMLVPAQREESQNRR